MTPKATQDLARHGKRSHHKCKECGLVENNRHWAFVADRLEKSGLCQECEHWLNAVNFKEQERVVRIKGHHYIINDEIPGPAHLKGHKGQKFIIKFNDERQVVTTNLWHQGKIPEHFKERLPDNAVFLIVPE
ncbi:MAG: hypothetical protein ACW99U_21480 [Candidatus Thorarchaeota archaeon]|jgi:hypothetical protein